MARPQLRIESFFFPEFAVVPTTLFCSMRFPQHLAGFPLSPKKKKLVPLLTLTV